MSWLIPVLPLLRRLVRAVARAVVEELDSTLDRPVVDRLDRLESRVARLEARDELIYNDLQEIKRAILTSKEG